MTDDNIFHLDKVLSQLHHLNIYCKYYSYKSVLGNMGINPRPTRLIINLNGFSFTIGYNEIPKIIIWKN